MDDKPLRIGDVLHGYCGGCFGRDAYQDKRVIAIGADWVIAQEEGGGPLMYAGDPEALREYREPLDEWGNAVSPETHAPTSCDRGHPLVSCGICDNDE